MSTHVVASVALVALVVSVGPVANASAQVAEATERFEVATVKPNKTADAGPRFDGPPGRFSATGVTLHELILFAYQLQAFEIFGAPSWATSDRFDVAATMEPAPTGTSPGPRNRRMLRALLAERFKLVVHEERREMPVYALALARTDRKLGARLRPFEGECLDLKGPPASLPAQLPAQLPASSKGPSPCILGLATGRLSARGMLLSNLASTLATFPAVRRRVIDRTGLTGPFDFDLEWTPTVTPAASAAPGTPIPSDAGPNLFTALQEQLGLKLESAQEAVSVLIIDSVNRPSPD
jgi:uncharacterized protein (TIGR03435 family)